MISIEDAAASGGGGRGRQSQRIPARDGSTPLTPPSDPIDYCHPFHAGLLRMTTPVDVLIIGAGASGAAVAWSLAETKMHILCLEQGDWMKPSEYPSTARDWEARQLNDFHISSNRRARDTDYPINDADSPIKIANFNGVGGGTVLWSGHFPRFRPSDFRVRTLDGVADDWPLSYWDLAPFYDQNDAFIGVSGLHGDPAYPPRAARHGPPLGLDLAGEAYVRGLERLGWHWWPS